MATRSSAPASASKATKSTPATPVAKPSGTESPATARTEQFTPVRLNAPAESGMIVDVTVTGHDGRQLLAA